MFEEFLLANRLNEEELEKMIMFVTRYFNFKNTMFRVQELKVDETFGKRYKLYWTMLEAHYNELCEKFSYDVIK